MTRSISFRYVILKNGVDAGQIYPSAGSVPTVRMNSSGEIKSSLRGSFVDPEDAVNWLSDQIRAEIIIDGTTHHIGVFLPASVRQIEDSTSKIVTIEAYDRCWILRDTVAESMYFIPAGTNYIEAVTNLLTAAGIALIQATPSTETLAEDREDWEMGTSYLKIINQLLSEINYKALWFNQDGVAILEPESIPTANNIKHTLDDTTVKSLIIPGINRETDVYKSPNVFICVCSNPDKDDVMVARSENTNPQSPLSTKRRGRSITSVVNVDNIASQAELQNYADQLRDKSMIAGETIQVSTALLPGYGADDVTSIKYGDLFAICIERAWSMSLQVGGNMTHKLERVVIELG